MRKVVLEDKFTRTAEDKEKEGMFIGKYAINPVNDEKVPIYIGNFILLGYGAGAVMAVPAHDQRDFEFAKKYKIKIKEVVKGGNVKNRAYVGEGKMINSGKFNNLKSQEAYEKITLHLKEKRCGRKKIQ